MNCALLLVKRNKTLFGAMVFAVLWCIGWSAYVVATFENPINYRLHLINTSDYPWMILISGAQIASQDYQIEVWWGEEDNIMVQMFDNHFNSPPSNSFNGNERIPQGARRMQFDFVLRAPIDLNIWMFMLQYDEDGRIFEADEIEQLHTSLRFHAGMGAAATRFTRNYSFEAQVHPSASSFKIMLQARPTHEMANTNMTISNMRIAFR